MATTENNYQPRYRGPTLGRVSSFLVTGSSGHLGDALVRTLRVAGHRVVGLDLRPGPGTTVCGSVSDPGVLGAAMAGVEHVLHTATLHKPHIGSHHRRDFVEVNVAGTSQVLDAATEAGVRSLVFTSSTSVFGRAMTAPEGAAAVWVNEDLVPRVKNVYGATKAAAEDLCELTARDGAVAVVVLRTARFFPERDDEERSREAFADVNLKTVEFLHRRVDLADVVSAHLLAAQRAPELGFARYVVSAPTPFTRCDLPELATDARAVIERLFPDLVRRFDDAGWRLPMVLDRVYDSSRARAELGWAPVQDFARVADRALRTGEWRGELAVRVGARGYHDRPTGVYTE